MELGGDGPLGLPFMPFDIRGCVPFEDPEIGGVTRLPRLCGRVGEYGGGPLYLYCDTPDHSLPWVEFGERGPDRPLILGVYTDASFEAEYLKRPRRAGYRKPGR